MAVSTSYARLIIRQPGYSHEEGNSYRLLVEDGFADDVVLAELVAMLAGEHDDGAVGDPGLVQRAQHAAQGSIHQSHIAPVPCDQRPPI